MSSDTTRANATYQCNHPSLTQVVPDDVIQQICSDYFETNWRLEQSHFETVRFDPPHISATAVFSSYLRGSDGLFHFSALQADRLIQQLTVIYCRLRLGQRNDAVKQTLLRRFQIECHRPIHDPQCVALCLTEQRSRSGGKLGYIDATFDICDGAFTGAIAAVATIMRADTGQARP